MFKKVYVVKQNSIKDCGPCALLSIIMYYHGYVNIEKIRQDTFTSNEGCSVYNLIKAAQKYGFDARALKDDNSSFLNTRLPAIVHVHYENGLNHFLCVYEINEKYVLLMDPAKGKVKMNINDFFKIYSNIKIELFPKNNIVLLERKTSIYELFFRILTSNKKLSFHLLLTNVFLIVFSLASSLYFKYRYEAFEKQSDSQIIRYMIFCFFLITILKIVFSFFKNYYENHLNKNIDASVYNELITHIFKLPLKVIETHQTGEIMTRFNEVNNIKELFSEMFITSVLEIGMLVVCFIILFNINCKLSLILLFMLLIYIIISIVLNPYLYKRICKNIDIETDVNSTLIENIEMISSTKHLNQTQNVLLKLENKMANLLYDNFDFKNVFNTFSFVKDGIIDIGIFIINTYGFYLLSLYEINIIDLFLFNSLFSYLINPVKNITNIILKYNYLRASFNRVCDFVEIEEEKEGNKEKFINGDISFENVNFTYNNYTSVMSNLNLNIKKNEKIVLKGHSGCGKSTLCQLINKEYKPNSGRIYINGKNIEDYSIKTIRENITYVGQKERIFTDTIKNNILFNEKFSQNRFDNVCKVCELENIVNKKPFRYESGIDNNYSNLSGGEKQRIILARALYKKSEILILDEALSEVDYKLESKIINNIINAYSNKTLIYISHKNHDNLFSRVVNIEEIHNELS